MKLLTGTVNLSWIFCSLCVLEIVRRINDVPWTAIKRFFTRQLNRFFAMPSQEGKKISLNAILTSRRIPGYPPPALREENRQHSKRKEHKKLYALYI